MEPMEVFLIIVSLAFLVAGSLFLLSPGMIKKIYEILNKTAFNLDGDMMTKRRLTGIIFLALSIILWYIALYK